MSVHRVTRGLRIPISGEPAPELDEGRGVSRIALLGADYVGLHPTFAVAAGDTVSRGQLLFEDRHRPGVRFTAPASGRVAAIHRGARRVFQSLVIELSSAEQAGRGAQIRLAAFTGRHPASLGGDAVRDLLVESGLWTALRARPFSRVADPASRPHAIFVTAIDTEPLAPPVDAGLDGRVADVEQGLSALLQLTDGLVFVCTGASGPVPDLPDPRVRLERFAGPHPAGTPGYHMHALAGVGRDRVAWHVGYQDLAAIGHLFRTGEIDPTRVVALAGPAVARPRLVRTRLGASTDELVSGELTAGEARVVSGSVLSGRRATGPELGYLGRYHRQVAVLGEDRRRELLGWARPGAGVFSATRAFASRFLPARDLALTTSTHGAPRAIVPIGVYERVMPFDLPPTYLLKALVTHDVERAEQLGCLELDEEDLALCTYVCPGKHEYGPHLRQVLAALEAEG